MKNKRNLILTIVEAIFLVLLVFGLLMFVKTQINPTPVFVWTQEIEAGQDILPNHIKEITIPGSAVNNTFLKDKKKIDTKKLLKEVHFVPESVPIHKLFKQLQKNKMQMAIVIDEYGGTAGLVTMEDILEELVGNIFDEHDEEELEYKLIDENTYMVNGNISIGDLEKIIGIEISDGDYETLSGYLLEKLEELPMEGEETIIEDEKLTYKIEEYEDKRIKQVKICKNK